MGETGVSARPLSVQCPLLHCILYRALLAPAAYINTRMPMPFVSTSVRSMHTNVSETICVILYIKANVLVCHTAPSPPNSLFVYQFSGDVIHILFIIHAEHFCKQVIETRRSINGSSKHH